nr:reverse transcriptase zinc-binding domain-containing protein [Tanacetum cinerariifolium]
MTHFDLQAPTPTTTTTTIGHQIRRQNLHTQPRSQLPWPPQPTTTSLGRHHTIPLTFSSHPPPPPSRHPTTSTGTSHHLSSQDAYREKVFILDLDGALMSTQEYMQKVVEDVGTIHGSIHYKVIGEGGYEKDITVGAAMILANVLVFTLKPSKHYLNITKRNVVNVFRKDTVPESGND